MPNILLGQTPDRACYDHPAGVLADIYFRLDAARKSLE